MSHLQQTEKLLDYQCLKRVKKYRLVKDIFQMEGKSDGKKDNWYVFSIKRVHSNRVVIHKPEKVPEESYEVIGENDVTFGTEDPKPNLQKKPTLESEEV